ncbi:MAG TPA: hypothetical protein PL034_01820 [Candidatus Paceibacterota bacterium]|nr:hypothetical protein [Candidatus Paceibacterota bacterium]
MKINKKAQIQGIIFTLSVIAVSIIGVGAFFYISNLSTTEIFTDENFGNETSEFVDDLFTNEEPAIDFVPLFIWIAFTISMMILTASYNKSPIFVIILILFIFVIAFISYYVKDFLISAFSTSFLSPSVSNIPITLFVLNNLPLLLIIDAVILAITYAVSSK